MRNLQSYNTIFAGQKLPYPTILLDGNTVAWYDYKKLITKDESDLVSIWGDLSGNSNDLLQATEPNQPKWYLDDGVLFDGVNSFMKTNAFTFNQPEMIYIVFKQITWASNQYVIDGFTTASGVLRQTQGGVTPQINAFANSNSTPSSDLALDTFGIVRVLFNGSNSKLRVNNNEVITGNFGTANMGGITIGSVGAGGAAASNIQVKEIIFRNVADSENDETIIYNYLANKYDIYSMLLPQQLITVSDTVIDDMESTSGWTLELGASLVLNNTEYHDGSGSIKITSNEGQTMSVSKIGSWDMSKDNGASLRMWIYAHTAPVTTFSTISIYLFNGTNYVAYGFGGSELDTWKYMIGSTIGDITEEMDFSNITKIRITVFTKSGQTAIVSLDSLTWGYKTIPAVLLTFDDTLLSTYTEAYPLISERSMVGTAYVQANNIDTENHMTGVQLLDLYANKWGVGNHSNTHPYFTSLTEVQIIDEINACKTDLDSLGIIRDTLHVAYPYGAYNQTVDDAMVSLSAKTGRNVTGGYSYFSTDNIYHINARGVNNTILVETIKGYIDDIISRNACLFLVIHDLNEEAPNIFDFKISDFEEVLNYIALKQVQTLTIDEWYRLNTGSVEVSHK